jgi:catechol 2,3-dioxygenase-like lactoylglutathione lyase family enzyme
MEFARSKNRQRRLPLSFRLIVRGNRAFREMSARQQQEASMIDHIGFPVSDYARSKSFYEKALAPLGYTLIMEVGGDHTESGSPAAGFGKDGKPDFWIGGEGGLDGIMHVAIAANDRRMVDAFHRAALAAGGKDNGAPGLRAHYHPNYYGAFVLDPDGHNVEAVCHAPA